jgi:glucosyl-3-phosphoglycerate synthase
VTNPLSPEQGEPSTEAVRTFDVAGLSVEAVSAAKGATKTSVVLPARNEESTIGWVLEAIRPHLKGRGTGLLDEILVVDDGSSDQTAQVAKQAGVEVLSLSGSGGKGQALAAGVAASRGDLLVFLDADVVNTSPDYIPRLLGPLLLDDSVALVKGYYDRPINDEPSGGGRVTSLTARPALQLLFPELAGVLQPLAGETALRREILDKVELAPGYRVEMALLIDVSHAYGASSIAQVDLGVRVHRNRPLHELSLVATEVLAVALERSGLGWLPLR